jgi:hypothetical protein
MCAMSGSRDYFSVLSILSGCSCCGCKGMVAVYESLYMLCMWDGHHCYVRLS